MKDAVSVRVLLSYDRKENRKEFTVLTEHIRKEMHRKIVAWLEDNVQVSDVMCRLQENALEADKWSINKMPN